MANQQIHNYTAANTIDASADLLLIDPASSGIYKSINRNTLLALTSQPLGLTDSQSPQNKTFDNTNSITVKDGSLTIQNTASPTKQAVFSAASITAGQTRTFTFPDASGTLVTTGATQTLTSKTLTSPAITGGTIDNSTITVDSISGHTSATTVTIANLQIVNGVLNTANSVTATAVAAGAIQPQALVTGTGSGWAWTSQTPSFTNVTVGNGTASARYIQIGKTVFFRGEFTLGSTSSISGSVTVTLPITSRNDSGYEIGVFPIGHAIMIDAGINQYAGVAYQSSTTTMLIQTVNASATYATTTAVANATTPFTFGTGDGFLWNVVYEAA